MDEVAERPMTETEREDKAQAQLKKEAQQEKLEVFAKSLTGERNEAISARQSSGVEERWRRDSDQYHGVDAFNRPVTDREKLQNGENAKAAQTQTQGAKVYVQVTRQRTDAGAARLADMLYPTDEKNWAIGPTPVPDLDEAKQRARDKNLHMGPPGDPTPDPDDPTKPLMAEKVIQEDLDHSKKAGEAMEREIDDYLVECDYNAEGRAVIDDAAQLGTGILKGPVVVNRTSKRWKKVDLGNGETDWEVEVIEDNRPASFRVDCWNIYPDAACGENPKNGNYLWEVGDTSERQLRDLIKTGAYFEDQVRECLMEGPSRYGHARGHQEGRHGLIAGASDSYFQNQYELWTRTGLARVSDLRACDCEVDEELDDTDAVSAIVVLCNNRVIMAKLNPMDKGELPYDFFVWSKVRGSPWGIGIPYMTAHAQASLNAGWRTALDNAGVSFGPQIVMRKGTVIPADGIWEVRGNKIWLDNTMPGVESDVKEAFTIFNIDNNMEDLMRLIDLSMKWIDEESGMSMLAQGEMGRTPDHVGVAQIMQQAANVVIRRLAKRHDDTITQPHISRYYDWAMQHSENDLARSGDLQVRARGSTELMMRDLQGQMMELLAQKAEHPIFGVYLDPEKILKKQIQSGRIAFDEVRRSDDEIKRILDSQKAKAEQGEPEDPRIAAAQINAQASLQREQVKAEGMVAAVQTEADSELLNAQVRAEAARLDDERERQLDELKRDMEIYKFAQQNNLDYDRMKVDLAMKVMDNEREAARERAQASQQAAGGFNPRGGGDERPSVQ